MDTFFQKFSRQCGHTWLMHSSKKLDTGPQQVHFAYYAQVTRVNSFPQKNCYHFSLHQFMKFRDLLQAHTHTHTPVWRPFFRVSQYQKGKIDLDFTEARDSEWQWHQLGHMQVCTLLQTDNNASNPPLSFLQAWCPSCRPTNSVKALKGWRTAENHVVKLTRALLPRMDRATQCVSQNFANCYTTVYRNKLYWQIQNKSK